MGIQIGEKEKKIGKGRRKLGRFFLFTMLTGRAIGFVTTGIETGPGGGGALNFFLVIMCRAGFQK